MKSKTCRITGFVILISALSFIVLDGFVSLPENGSKLCVCDSSLIQNLTPTAEKDEILGELRFEGFGFVKQFSAEYGVDFRLILAIIKQESQFNSDARSDRGAIGFMQLMPVTNAEISEVLELDGTQPHRENLKAGIYYFAQLLELFKDCEPEDRICFALAAYNAGPMRVYDAQELAAYMGENPHHWSTIQNVLPLLSKRYYSLHKSVWNNGKPRSGYFGSSRQTETYVENTLRIFNIYKNLIRSGNSG
ncbi:MAG: transglycosylase SLT domain-containing protein [Ignavibacteria bacterium]|nr:transglycosylase SLT domain-containing protein [Ignavibacteria bacterium]MBI3766053.1 transglycosylase SLT domain-containing protein [Ignavibacteriales bacterium]